MAQGIKWATEEQRLAARKEASRRHYERNKDRVIAKAKERNEKKPLRTSYLNWCAKLKRAYGITAEQYSEMLLRQGGTCAICHGPPTRGDDGFVVDHCHVTGVARGLLCHMCNSALGLLLDDPEVVRRAMEYLNA